MSEEKSFSVTVEFMGHKFRKSVMATNQMEANALVLSKARARMKVHEENDFDIDAMMGEVLSAMKQAAEFPKLAKELHEKFQMIQLIDGNNPENMRIAMTDMLRIATAGLECVDIMIEARKRAEEEE